MDVNAVEESQDSSNLNDNGSINNSVDETQRPSKRRKIGHDHDYKGSVDDEGEGTAVRGDEDFHEFKSRGSKIMNKVSSWNEENFNQIKKLKLELHDKQQELAVKDKKIEKLNEEKDLEKQHLEKLQTDLNDKDKEIAAKDEEIQKLKEIQDSEKQHLITIKKLQSELKNKDQQNKDLKEDLDKKVMRIHELNKELGVERNKFKDFKTNPSKEWLRSKMTQMINNR